MKIKRRAFIQTTAAAVVGVAAATLPVPAEAAAIPLNGSFCRIAWRGMVSGAEAYFDVGLKDLNAVALGDLVKLTAPGFGLEDEPGIITRIEWGPWRPTLHGPAGVEALYTHHVAGT